MSASEPVRFSEPVCASEPVRFSEPVCASEPVRIGIITKSRGLRGDVSVTPLTDDPKRFKKLKDVIIECPDKGIKRTETIDRVGFLRDSVIVKFEGCNDAETAQAYKGCYIAIMREQLIKPAKDSYFIFDLIGCEVSDADGKIYGTLTDILETGANDVYEINSQNSDGGFLIPAIKSAVIDVDIVSKKIKVNKDYVVAHK